MSDYNRQNMINQIIQNKGGNMQHAYDILPHDVKNKQHNVRATRGASSKKGMNSLAHIVLDEKRDLKRIRSAITLDGAIAYARKMGNYTARLEDLNNDGINDVIIRRGTDENGPVVVVNGWTTTASDFPYRQEYYEAFPSSKARKESNMNMKKYFNNIINTQYDEYGNVVSYNVPTELKKIIDSGGYKQIKPRDKSSYQMFISEIIKKIYDNVANSVNVHDRTLLISVSGDVWNTCIIKPFYSQLLGGINQLQTLESDSKAYKKFTNSNSTKSALKEYVMSLIYEFNNGDSAFVDNAVVPVLQQSIIEKYNEKIQKVPAGARGYVSPSWSNEDRREPSRKHYVPRPENYGDIDYLIDS